MESNVLSKHELRLSYLLVPQQDLCEKHLRFAYVVDQRDVVESVLYPFDVAHVRCIELRLLLEQQLLHK